MTDGQLAETVFQRNERREAEINDALKQEYARRGSKGGPILGTSTVLHKRTTAMVSR
jgi:hypothetical protein